MNGQGSVKFSSLSSFVPVEKKNKKIIVDEWEAVTKKKHRMNTNSNEKICARLTNRSTIRGSRVCALNIGIGIDICEMLGWQKADKIQVLFHRVDKHIVKLEKAKSDADGYSLSHTSNAKNKMYVKLTIDSPKNPTVDKTIEPVFELKGDYIICDLEEIIGD